MTDMEMNILSRLAMLKLSGNVNGRFAKAEKSLKDDAFLVAQAIRTGDRSNGIAKSLLERAAYELGEPVGA